MADPKQVYRASDAAPVAIYAKRDTNSDDVYPVTPGMMFGGMTLPAYDSLVVDTTDSANITLTYKLSGVTVATKTVGISGSVITITKTS